MSKRNWTTLKEYEEILFDFYNGIARITINRPRYYNAFTPKTNMEMIDAMQICRENPKFIASYSLVLETKHFAVVVIKISKASVVMLVKTEYQD